MSDNLAHVPSSIADRVSLEWMVHETQYEGTLQYRVETPELVAIVWYSPLMEYSWTIQRNNEERTNVSQGNGFASVVHAMKFVEGAIRRYETLPS